MICDSNEEILAVTSVDQIHATLAAATALADLAQGGIHAIVSS